MMVTYNFQQCLQDTEVTLKTKCLLDKHDRFSRLHGKMEFVVLLNLQSPLLDPLFVICNVHSAHYVKVLLKFVVLPGVIFEECVNLPELYAAVHQATIYVLILIMTGLEYAIMYHVRCGDYISNTRHLRVYILPCLFFPATYEQVAVFVGVQDNSHFSDVSVKIVVCYHTSHWGVGLRVECVNLHEIVKALGLDADLLACFQVTDINCYWD